MANKKNSTRSASSKFAKQTAEPATSAASKNSTKSERTKQALSEALEQLMHEKPLSKITVRAVATCAGVDRQTFYYHFDTMDDLLDYLCRKRLSILTDDMLATALENEGPHDLFIRVVQQVDSVRDVLVPLLSNSGRKLLLSAFYEAVHSALVSHMRARADEASVFVSSSDVEAAALYCQCASVHIVVDWLCGDGVTDPKLKPETVADLLSDQLDLHAKGLVAKAKAAAA